LEGRSTIRPVIRFHSRDNYAASVMATADGQTVLEVEASGDPAPITPEIEQETLAAALAVSDDPVAAAADHSAQATAGVDLPEVPQAAAANSPGMVPSMADQPLAPVADKQPVAPSAEDPSPAAVVGHELVAPAERDQAVATQAHSKLVASAAQEQPAAQPLQQLGEADGEQQAAKAEPEMPSALPSTVPSDLPGAPVSTVPSTRSSGLHSPSRQPVHALPGPSRSARIACSRANLQLLWLSRSEVLKLVPVEAALQGKPCTALSRRTSLARVSHSFNVV
jgi:hypothetical protein